MEDSLDQFANNLQHLDQFIYIFSAQAQNANQALYNLGVDNYGWAPAFADYKQILEQLKCEDEMIIYEAMINLNNQLSMAQENTLASFPLDQYIPVLIDILKRPPQTDLANEVNMFVIQCLTNLMDIFPTVCGTIVNHGAVKSITDVLERTMGFIDLNDACVKCMEKISLENPYAILTSGAMGLCLNMMDFFEIPTQKRILTLMLNVSRHSASEQDLNEHILPVLPCLCTLLQSRGDHAISKIESVVQTVLRIAESIMRFYSPLSHFDKVTEQVEKIGDSGIIDGILQKLQDYCVIDDSMEVDQPNQIQQSVQKSLNNNTIQYTLKLLTLCSRYSARLTSMMVEFDIFRLLSKFLPSKEDLKKIQLSQDKFPFIIETIQLLETLLPDREEQLKSDHEKLRLVVENTKRALYDSQQQMVFFMAEKLLPKIFLVYENNMTQNIRNKALKVIDKMIALFNDELLNNFIEPYSFAKFIYSNLRSNQLPAMQLCLQMVDKLIKSNAKNYTLPLMREGVTEYIKKISTKEQLEKTLNIKLDEQAQQPDQSEKPEEFLAKARLAMLAKADNQDQESKAQLEQTIQKYLEASRIQQLHSQAVPNKTLIETAKQVLDLAGPLNGNFFENEEFQEKLNEWYGEEFKMIKMLKNLANDIIEEAKQVEFNFDRTKALLKQCAECLTNKRHIMNFEFKQSGLLEALELFLTHSPKQVQAICEKQRQGEEVKHSEEMVMSQMMRSSQQVSKKEARCFIQRLKVFAHIVLSNFNDKKPILELINLCHDQLSQSENEIFNVQQADPAAGSVYGNLFANQVGDDANSSVNALRQLTKRSRVNLVYDPEKSFLKISQKESLASMSSKDAQGMLQPPQLTQTKASSHHPAFLVLGGEKNKEDEPHSKVYLKRHFLFNELQQVLISVEQCASLWLLEDFLRNKIRTMDDVKTLKQPHSYYSGLKRGSSSFQQSSIARQFLDRAMDSMRDIIESGGGREQMRQEGEEFAERMAQEIIDCKELTDIDQVEIIKQLETQTLQMMDDFYAEQEGSQYEDVMRNDLMEGDGDDMNTEQKILELQRIIETVRLLYRNKKIDREAELERLKTIKAQTSDAEMKVENQQLNLEEQVEKLKQPALQQEQQPVAQQEELKQSEEAKREDVEMTDEDEEEQKRAMDQLEQKRTQSSKKMTREVELSVQDNQQVKDMDLDELIKAAGDDIEFEFYYNGQLVGQNQTIFEIVKQAEAKAKPSDYLGQALGGYRADGSSTIHFLIKDKRDDLHIQRKDSLLEFSARRERTKSEAVEDISVSAVNSLVSQLIDKEFQVFSKDLISEAKTKDSQKQEIIHLEQALKILKVLNYICRNIQLFSNQGVKFIINSFNQEEEKDEMFSDLALQIGISELQANAFHHHKLDTFILKNIQDPYNLIGGGISETLQQIFRNCPFLFPFQTRQLFFKLISFIGSIDMNRSIYFLRQFLKNKLGKLPAQDKNTAVKFQKQKVVIDRNRILDSAHSLMKQINKRAFLEVQYKDEAGTGLGPTLEFYYLVSNEIRNAEISLNNLRVSIWRKGMIDNSLFPSPISIPTLRTDELQRVYEIFRLTGMMIAKSVSDDRLIDLPISPLMWDLVLGKKMNIFDLERIDKDLFKIFADLQMLANRKRDLDKQVFIDQEAKSRQQNTLRTAVNFSHSYSLQQGARVEDLGLNFTLPGYENIELKQNGKAIDVTLNNLQEYIDLVMHYTFHESVKIQISAFKKGFNSIFPVDTLKPFSSTNELEDMICGVQRNDEDWTNLARLMENVIPLHGYHSKSNEYRELLKFMSELDHEERRKFLKFVTGSPRLPNGGFAALEPKLTVVLKKPINPHENPDDILPSVMTCQNYIKLPSYSSYEKLKAKFQMAYNEGTNNFTLS